MINLHSNNFHQSLVFQALLHFEQFLRTNELIEADLNSDDGWQEAVADVDYILHVASPFVLAKPRDPNELITPAQVLLRKLKFVKGESSSLPLVLQSCKGKRREYSDDD